MNDEPREVEHTNRDLMADYDESKFDRIGKPITIEEHNVGKPETQAETTTTSHTLLDMAKDYEFFTTAVIHATTIFDRDPLSEFNKLHPTELDDGLPVAIDYAMPFFCGLGVCLVAGIPVNFDHRLYAIVRSRWDKLRDTILGMAMIHRKTHFYARLNFYEMEIVDPFALKKMTVVNELPRIPVTVFGVSSNKAFSYLQSQPYPALPRLVREPPRADIKLEGSKVLGPPPSPESLLPKKRA